MKMIDWPQTVLLAGGVGGAKLADGFSQLLPPGKLTIIANTGDDFEHMGLTICPDMDTVMYTLAGVANPDTGWGRADESWRVLSEVEKLGGPAWFRLGDLDLATHLTRTHMLANGASLTAVTRHLCRQLGMAHDLLPMSDQAAPTLIRTDDGLLSFQDWFVAQKWQPPVCEVILPADVRATPAVMVALEKADLVVLAPSNPFVSLDPILNVYPIREMVADLPDFVAAVSPIIGGEAVKGPAAKMMSELGMTPSAGAVAAYYNELIDVFVYDVQDGEPAIDDMLFLQTNTLMQKAADRRQLATAIINHIMELRTQ
jgi:LPPG:FO 2-phospho-L-lactate transferase